MEKLGFVVIECLTSNFQDCLCDFKKNLKVSMNKK